MNKYQLVKRIASIFFLLYLYVSFGGYSVLDGWGFGAGEVVNLGGRFGACLSFLIINFLGIGAFIIPLSLLFIDNKFLVARVIFLSVFFSFAYSLFSISFNVFDSGDIRGGLLGHYLVEFSQYLFGYSGSILLLLSASAWILAPVFMFLYKRRIIIRELYIDKTNSFIKKTIKTYFATLYDFIFDLIHSKKGNLLPVLENMSSQNSPHDTAVKKTFMSEASEVIIPETPTTIKNTNDQKTIFEKVVYNYKNKVKNPFDKSNSKYELPSLRLLEPKDFSMRTSRAELNAVAIKIEEKLATFNIEGKVKDFHDGPVVSQYEFQPDEGVKISQLVNLSDDLSMALSSQAVRVLGQIPGKNVVGIEVPKKDREDVFISEILGSASFEDSNATIPLALGKTTDGTPYIGDLAKMPHLLVAGTTGSGKSMFEASVLCGLCYRFKPHELKMILIDPKRVDLQIWNEFPHLLYPVVSDPKECGLILKWAVHEMERRYELIAQLGVRDISSFNEKIKTLPKETREEMLGDKENLPNILIMIDELADLMMMAKQDVEKSICRLAQKARAAGIHLMVATQRPSTDVITGLIKANFPTRLSFRVASAIDSRTILDKIGAERLLGRGDMLFIPPGSSHIIRLHGARVTEKEVEMVVQHITSQQKAQYEIDLALEDDEGNKQLSVGDLDSMFDQAKDVFKGKKQASTSYLQRALNIGYPRAARIMDQLEAKGVVGPSKGGKVRDVLV